MVDKFFSLLTVIAEPASMSAVLVKLMENSQRVSDYDNGKFKGNFARWKKYKEMGAFW